MLRALMLAVHVHTPHRPDRGGVATPHFLREARGAPPSVPCTLCSLGALLGALYVVLARCLVHCARSAVPRGGPCGMCRCHPRHQARRRARLPPTRRKVWPAAAAASSSPPPPWRPPWQPCARARASSPVVVLRPPPTAASAVRRAREVCADPCPSLFSLSRARARLSSPRAPLAPSRASLTAHRRRPSRWRSRWRAGRCAGSKAA